MGDAAFSMTTMTMTMTMIGTKTAIINHFIREVGTIRQQVCNESPRPNRPWCSQTS